MEAPGLDDIPIFHVKDPVAHLRQFFVMRNDQEGLVELFAQIEEKLVKLPCIGRVQVTGRLIRKYDLWTVDQGAGYGYTLLFAAGELIRLVIGAVSKAQGLQEMYGPVCHFLLFSAGDPAGNTHIFQSREFRKKVVELENEPDMFVAEGRNLPVVQEIDGLPVDRHLAFVWLIQGAQDMQECTFPGSGRAYNAGNFALGDIDVHSFQHP